MQKFRDKLILKENFQYFVGLRIAFLTSLSRPSIESTKAIKVSMRIGFQVPCVAVQSSVLVLNRFPANFFFTIAHKFSIDDKPGLYGGVRNNLISLSEKNPGNRTSRPQDITELIPE